MLAPSGPGAWYFGGEERLDQPRKHRDRGHSAGTHLGEHFTDGFNVGARAGYEWGPWRFEEEFRFQQQRAEQRH